MIIIKCTLDMTEVKMVHYLVREDVIAHNASKQMYYKLNCGSDKRK